MKLKEQGLKIKKFYKEFEKIRLLKESKVSDTTRMKILASTKTSQIGLITDTFKNVTKVPLCEKGNGGS